MLMLFVNRGNRYFSHHVLFLSIANQRKRETI